MDIAELGPWVFIVTGAVLIFLKWLRWRKKGNCTACACCKCKCEECLRRSTPFE
ncbi:MAG: hypothetical protein UY24_C0043G0005 [Parcubacteria group bacterium GW2011_GWA1_48_11b]|uniref:FeoB-associated Cys-rich membrane protein n=1 Tax=Candidatus Giovannonibacteria bacterium GW2011_GWB1_47_6b TaxID=1618655 RepID=A0A0G1VCG4_9BACT|nr:MAG: hypothetical protein UY02_C0041G0002 [Candidatus Giovannonibacteria bacterium GW2011_GWB1_47_6b]KKU92080.1 MAG: hypothetical protein UY24_C0043G0005 [Parcubacteria group bacterium GW2011_GWA1_48_11b]